jgi:hypothetical protein
MGYCASPQSRYFTFKVLRKRTALDPGSAVSVYPAGGAQSLVRRVSMSGIGPYSKPGYGNGGACSPPSVIRIVGVDIEQSTYYRVSDFL